MKKFIFSMKGLFALIAAVCLSFAFGGLSQVETNADVGNDIQAKVEQVKTQNDGSMLMLFFNYEGEYTTDYMTTAWSPESNETYHWYLPEGFGMPEEDIAKYESRGGQLAYEDRDKYNMPNAVLDKNLDAYNLGEYILIDGKPLNTYNYSLVANRWTLVHTLSIELNGSTAFAGVTELQIKAGCTLPTLTYSYFGEGEPSALVIEEEQNFRNKNGGWVKVYPFAGYEKGVEYDATEQFLYSRQSTANFYGYTEAYTCEFTDALNRYYQEDGISLASTSDTVKGSLLIYDFVNPINANEFGTINLCLFSHAARTFVSYNAYNVTASSKGMVVESLSKSSGFTVVTLQSALYANEDGYIDRLVFEFTNDGMLDKPNENHMFLAYFSFGDFNVNTIVYDKSFIIQDNDTYYDLTLRFNKKGEFSGDEALDTSKVLINGVSVDEINKNGTYAVANWMVLSGIYHINVRLDKAYQGPGQFKNVDLEYTGSKFTVEKDLVFPNGDLLDRTYTCNIYQGEAFVDYEFIKEYKDTKVTDVELFIDKISADNLHFYVIFNQKLCSQTYFHADQRETWRETALRDYGAYDPDFAKVYLAGGFKSSLLDNVMINGKTLAQWHAIDLYETCIFVHYAQASEFTLDVSIDSRSETYAQLLPLFEAGNGISITVKSGMKFPTAIKTSEDAEYILKDGRMVTNTTASEVEVFYDGKAVADGDVLKLNTPALESGIYVKGTTDYEVSKTVEGNKTTFVVTVEGETITFSVEQDVTELNPIDKQVDVTDDQGGSGCGSVISGSLMGGMAVLAFGVVTMLRRKSDE